MSTYAQQRIPRAELHHDEHTVTMAVTFRWSAEWSLDKCEVIGLVGQVRGVLVDVFKDHEHLAALESVLCWDPAEELLIGRYPEYDHYPNPSARPILFPSGEPELNDRDRELDQAWRDLLACVHTATHAAHGGEYGSLPMLADAGRGIVDALATIHPHRDGDSHEWTATERMLILQTAIERARRSYVWTARSLNEACSSAFRITAGWDNRRQEYAA